MIRTTAFVVIKGSDLINNMPSHFTKEYGRLNPDTERMNMRPWIDMVNDKSLQLGLGGHVTLEIDNVPFSLVSMGLKTDDDFKYARLVGEVLTIEEGKQFYNKHKIQE